jgi:hypothetical protein
MEESMDYQIRNTKINVLEAAQIWANEVFNNSRIVSNRSVQYNKERDNYTFKLQGGDKIYTIKMCSVGFIVTE